MPNKDKEDEAQDFTKNASLFVNGDCYEGWNFNSGNYLFTTDTK